MGGDAGLHYAVVVAVVVVVVVSLQSPTDTLPEIIAFGTAYTRFVSEQSVQNPFWNRLYKVCFETVCMRSELRQVLQVLALSI